MTGAYAASFLPVVLVPAVCMVTFAMVMALFFVYVESDA